MKLLCDRPLLQEAFAIAAGITPVKTPKAVLKNVLLRADSDGLTMHASDLEMSVQIHLDSVKVNQAGSMMVPARETSALLREITDPTVTLEQDDLRCNLRTGGGSFVLLGDDPEQFPQPADLQHGTTVEVGAARFAEMVRRTMFAAAKEESRYAINGLLVQSKGSRLSVVGTDGRRLSMCYENLEGEPGEAEMVVPLRALQVLLRALPDDTDERIRVTFGGQQAAFSLGESGAMQVTLITQLLESRFPDYEGVIPKAAETTVEMSRSLLESSVRRAAVLSAGDVRLVHFKFSSSSLELSAETSGVGRADVAMDVDVKGAGGSISFNPDFVIEALRATDSDIVRLDMIDDETPAKFTLSEAFTYVLMPISST